MTDYTKTTDFTSKDSLPSGDSGKIIRGAEFGTEFDNIETAVNSKSNKENPSFTGNITVTGTVDGRDIAADGTKLDTVETSADVTDTANVTAAGAVMDSELTDITAVKALNQGVATTDSPTFAAVTSTGNVTVGGTVDGRDVAADGTKLDTVETNADVTDTTNVTAAGALMDSEVTNLDQVKAFDSADYATAAQGTTADNALPKTGGAMTGAITTNSTFDGRDVATDGTKLDGIEASADVTDTANVTAAGAVMDSELTSEASVKALNQGVATTDSPTFAGATVNGTVEFDGLSGTGAVTVTDILDQDDMSGNSATALATQQSIKSYVDSQVATSDTLAEVLANGNATGGTDVAFDDNDKAIFGAGSDLQIYHDGSHSYIEDAAGTGNLKLRTNTFRIENAAGTELSALFVQDGAATLYNDNTARLATTSTGIDVTGTVTADAATVQTTGSTTAVLTLNNADGNGTLSQINLGYTADPDHGNISYTGDMVFTAGAAQRLLIGSGGDISFYEDTGTTAKLFWDASAESLAIGKNALSYSDSNRSNLEIKGSSSALLALQAGNENSYIFKNGTTLNIHNQSSGPMTFDTAATERMRIDSSGRVGIGTSSVSNKLSIDVTNTNTGTPFDSTSVGVIALQNTSTTANTSTAISNKNPTSDSANSFIQFINEDGAFKSSIAFGTATAGASNFGERMRIDSAGNVGIGVTPSSWSSAFTALQIEGSSVWSTGGDVALAANNYYNGTQYKYVNNGAASRQYHNTDGSVAWFQAGSGTAGATISFTQAMTLDASGNLLVGTTSSASGTPKISVNGSVQTLWGNYRVGTVFDNSFRQGMYFDSSNRNMYLFSTTSDTGGNIVFSTRNAAGSSDSDYGTERMRIDSSGNVGIGTDSPRNDANFKTLQIGDSSTAASQLVLDDNDSNGPWRIISNLSLIINDDTNERMRIDSSGNVGIGESSPSSFSSLANNLVVNSSTNSGITISESTGSGSSNILFAATSGFANRGNISYDHSATAMTFGINATERMRIDASGNVGIGTNSISQPSAGATTLKIKGTHNDKAGSIYLESANASVLAYIYPDSTNGLSINTSTSHPLVFRTVGAERMRIDSSGNLLVGRTTTINFPTNTTSGIRLGANRFDMAADSLCRLTQLNNASGEFDRFYIGSSIIGSITGSGSTTSYNTSSDQRLKENIVDAPSASDDIDAIQVRSFDWKADGSHQKYGMVAQELNTVAPEAVSAPEDPEEMMGVDYSKLVPMLVKEIQSLRARVAQLETN